MSKPSSEGNGDRLLLGGAIALLVIPVALDLLFGGPEAVFRYSAADAFYYHTVARNWARTGVATFDQTHATNGFHPLWQCILALLYSVKDRLGLSEVMYLRLSVLTCVALSALGLRMLGFAALTARGRLSPLFALLPTGVYALCIAPIWVFAVDVLHVVNPLEGRLPLYGTMWSFVNGMESSLAIFSFGALALAVVRAHEPSIAAALRIGAMCALLTLARLDHFFIAAAVAASIGWTDRGKSSVALATAFVTPLLFYLAVNRWYVGSAFPVSGSVKSTFPHLIRDNFRDLLALLIRPVTAARTLDRSFRLMQIVLPAVAIAVFAAARLRRPSDRWQSFLLAAGAGAMALAFYNFCFVRPYGPGQWYFPVSILLVTLVAMEVVHAKLAFAPLAALSLAVFFFLHRRLDYHARYADFYFNEAPLMKANYGADPPKVIELDDGIFAFGTGFPTFSGFGFAIDGQAYRAWKRKELGRLVLERGFDRAATVVYGDLKLAGITLDTPPEKVRSSMRQLFTQLGNLPEHDLAFDYLSPSGKTAIFRIVQKQESPPAVGRDP